LSFFYTPYYYYLYLNIFILFIINDIKKGEKMLLINGKKIFINELPNKEVLIDIDTTKFETINIEMKFESNADIFNLFLLKKHIDFQSKNKRVNLILKYIPYSRMDRVEQNICFTLKYFCEFINSLDFNRVIVYDPHSDVSSALINNIKIKSVIPNLIKRFKNDKNVLYVFPDATAYKRYKKYIDSEKYCLFIKDRDFTTGKIINSRIVGIENLSSSIDKVIIIDDLVSYEETFIITTNIIKKYIPAAKYILCVAHAEKNCFNGELFNNIDFLYTSDSIISSYDIPEIYKNNVLINYI
jgi:ribose-phosphate pyrophosphokinase